MSHFSIKCRACGKTLTDAFCAFCEHCRDALLVDDYLDAPFSGTERRRRLALQLAPGPLCRNEAARPVVYRSEGLAAKLGLENLYIAFNGYWPEKGALLETCTFKEFEAAVVLQNARENGVEGLIVASAGNTARAFAHLSAVTGFPVVIVVPPDVSDGDVVSRAAVCGTDLCRGRRRLCGLYRRGKADRDHAGVPLRGRRQEHSEARRARHRDARGGREDRQAAGPLRAGSGSGTARSAPGRCRSGS